MFPSRCSQLPCRNIDVSTESTGDLTNDGGDSSWHSTSPRAFRPGERPLGTWSSGRFASISTGIAPHWSKKRCCSHTFRDADVLTPATEVTTGSKSTKTATFTAISSQVMTGLRRSGLMS